MGYLPNVEYRLSSVPKFPFPRAYEFGLQANLSLAKGRQVPGNYSLRDTR